MGKLDLRKEHPDLFAPPVGDFVLVDVPAARFVKVDGSGDPNTAAAYKSAVEWLYAVSYGAKFASKAAGNDYVVPPLEGLWWADDLASFTSRRKHEWHWTMMLMVPPFVTAEHYAAGLAKATKKLGGQPPPTLRLEDYEEGLSAQIMHVGSYDDEAPTLARLHDEFLPASGLVENGPHHEIYLSDPRKTEATKLKTILRQPVRHKQQDPGR